jgi:hypothetical protein
VPVAAADMSPRTSCTAIAPPRVNSPGPLRASPVPPACIGSIG